MAHGNLRPQPASLPWLVLFPDLLTDTPADATTMATTKLSVAPPNSQHAAQAVLQVAERLYAMDPEWVVFFREVLGVDGIVRRTFGDADALVKFECSPQYARIREMLDALRTKERDQPPDRETQRVVTVRMPRSLHETLKAEAEQLRVSINTLCISKLMKLLDAHERGDLTEGRGRDETTSTRTNGRIAIAERG